MSYVTIYDFHQQLQQRKTTRLPTTRSYWRIMVIGAGGVGTWFVFHLAPFLREQNTIVIVDDDDMEPENLSRIPLPITYFYKREYNNIKKKAMLLASWLKTVNPDTNVVPITKRLQTTSELEYLVKKYDIDIIVDAVDDSRTIEMIQKYVIETRILRLLSIHYDGWHVSVKHCQGYQCSDWFTGTHQQGYRIVESSSLNASFASWLGVMLLIEGIYSSIIIDDIRQIPNILSRVRK